MNLLIWSQYFWPENFPVINKLTKALCDQAVNITILTGKPNYPSGTITKGYSLFGITREKFGKADVFRIPLIPRGRGSATGLALNYLSFILSGYLLAPFALRGKKFDAVFVYATSPLLQALPAIFISWLKGAPLIIWVQDLWPESLQATGFIKNRLLLWLVRIAVQYIYNRADSILVQSEGFIPFVEPLLQNKNKISFYPNGLEEMTYSGPKCDIAEEIGRHFSIVFAGNVGSAQSCEIIVAAAALLQDHPKIKFYIIGSGSNSAAIKSSVKNKGLINIVMTGHMSYDDMPSIFAASSALLLTLRSDVMLDATIPSKLQSYLSSGKPIIVSANGEVKKIVTNANAGLVCSAEDPQALASKVLELYNMKPQERKLLGENGYQYFKSNFDMKILSSQLVAHLKALSK